MAQHDEGAAALLDEIQLHALVINLLAFVSRTGLAMVWAGFSLHPSTPRMHSIDFIQDLAVIMLIAGLVTILFHRLKQPVVLGYIIAGVIIGPHTPPFAADPRRATIRTLSELGVVFLMFSLGLEFSLRKLTRSALTAFIAAVTEIAVMLGIGYGARPLVRLEHHGFRFSSARSCRSLRPPSSSRRSPS